MEVPKRRKLIVRFKGGPFSLVRSRDDKGDSGQMLISIDPQTQEKVGANGEIWEGCWIRCGSVTARSYEAQDWWMCTPLLKINLTHITIHNFPYILLPI